MPEGQRTKYLDKVCTSPTVDPSDHADQTHF